MSNMDLWNKVSKTDPSHTKKVNQRGGFTAIDAHYQIQNATEQFGPIGKGWGYVVEKMERHEKFMVVYVTIWHGDRSNSFGPVLGCSEMFGSRPDSDAPKKATTDAITKGLSQLGFNADVFLGKFDDNKYVAELKAKQKEATYSLDDNAKSWIAAIKSGSTTLDEITDSSYKSFIREQLK